MDGRSSVIFDEVRNTGCTAVNPSCAGAWGNDRTGGRIVLVAGCGGDLAALCKIRHIELAATGHGRKRCWSARRGRSDQNAWPGVTDFDGWSYGTCAGVKLTCPKGPCLLAGAGIVLVTVHK